MTRQMKDSGIEWIGEIPRNWDVKKVKHGFIRKNAKAQQDDPIILTLARSGVRVRDMSNNEGQIAESYYNYNPVDEGDLLLNPMDLYSGANCSHSQVKGVISPAYINLRALRGYNPVYFDYYFKLQYWSMAFFAHGKGVSFDNRWTLGIDTLFNYPIIVPPLDAQQKIAAILNAKCAEIDAVIEKTKESIEEYKKLKQTIIAQAVTKGIHGNRPLKNSGSVWLGTICQDYAVSRVGLHYEIILGKMICAEKKTVEMELYPYYCATNVHFNGVDNSCLKTMWFTPNEIDMYCVQKGDLLVVEGGAGAGGCAIVESASAKAGIQNSIMIVRPKMGANSRYLNYLIQSLVKRKYIDVVCNKATIPHFTKDKLGAMPYLVLSEKEQKEIADYLDARCSEIDALVAKKERFVAELENYKKSLIYEYVTGKREILSDGVQVAIFIPQFPAVLSTNKVRFAQAVLMSKILDMNLKNMGRVKLEKIMYTVEHSIGFDFDTQYVREAAGPLHSSIYECEGIISKRNKWYTINQSQHGVSYKPTQSKEKYKPYYDKYFSDFDAEIQRVVWVFKDYTTDQAEIVATIYGVWNDFLIEQRVFTDDDIVDEVLSNWNETKRRFSKDVWLRAIEAMRNNGIVPKGYGRHTVSKDKGGN